MGSDASIGCEEIRKSLTEEYEGFEEYDGI